MSEILAILHSRAVSPSRVLTSGDSRDERCRAAACAFPIKRSFFSPSHTRAYILFFHVEFPLHRNYLCSALYTRGALPRPKKCVLYVCMCECAAWRHIYRFRTQAVCDVYEHIELCPCTLPTSLTLVPHRFFHLISAVRIWGKKLHRAWCALQWWTSYTINGEYQKNS